MIPKSTQNRIRLIDGRPLRDGLGRDARRHHDRERVISRSIFRCACVAIARRPRGCAALRRGRSDGSRIVTNAYRGRTEQAGVQVRLMLGSGGWRGTIVGPTREARFWSLFINTGVRWQSGKLVFVSAGKKPLRGLWL